MLFEFFLWCETTILGTAIRNSIWAFPIIEAIHLLGLSLLGGTVLIVDLRLLGVGLTRQSASEISASIRPWLIGALVTMLTTGLLMFLAEAVKLYYNTSFWVKVVSLPLALLFTFTVKQRTANKNKSGTTARARAVGAVSILLWFTVAAAGRWIGYSS